VVSCPWPGPPGPVAYAMNLQESLKDLDRIGAEPGPPIFFGCSKKCWTK